MKATYFIIALLLYLGNGQQNILFFGAVPN